jgi:hypothetical protein
VRLRVLDRASRREELDSGPISTRDWILPGAAVIPVGLNLPLSNLASGSYTVEVQVMEEGSNAAVVRSTDFDIR